MKLSIDPGFGDTKIGISRGGTPTFFKETNTVVRLESDENLKFKHDPKDPNFVKNESGSFYIGGNSLQFPDSKIINVMDYEELKFVAPLIMMKYLRKFEGQIDSVVSAISIAYHEKASDFKTHLSNVTKFPIDKLKVIPQGVGSKIAVDNVGLDPDNPSLKEPFLNYLGIDIGFNTIDVFQVVDGYVTASEIKGHVNFGICKIAGRVMDYLKENGMEISISRARQAIYDRSITIRGQITNLDEVINKSIKDYIVFLHKFLENSYKDQLNAVTNVIIFGGGAEVIKSEKDAWNAFYDKNFVRFPERHAEYYNCLGCLFVD